MIKKFAVFCSALLLTACSVTSKPLTANERYDQATNDIKQLFSEQQPATVRLDFFEALARGMKYNLDYRIKLINTALQQGQLDIAEYAMFPALNISGSVYSRTNQYSSSGISGNGVQTDLSSSTPNTVRSARAALSWNILDFGMGYVRAKQQSERELVAEEEARRQLQQLSQDVLVAYWSAYSAQQLIAETKEFQRLLKKSTSRLSIAMRDATVPKENILNFQAALLEGNRRLIQLQYKYDKAMYDLKRLLFLPLDKNFVLAPPPEVFLHPQDISNLDFQKTDAVTLVRNPQLRGQHYQERIAQFGVKASIIQALPGITFNYAGNYNSNKFLLNQKWMDRSMDVAWNLLNLASLPSSYHASKLQVKYEQLKLMALTMGALTETRYAYSRYETLHKEYLVAHKQTENSQAIYTLNKHRQLASLASDQQVILAKLRVLTSKMDEDLLLSDLSVSLGELYLSVGQDVIPPGAESAPLSDAVNLLRKHMTHDAGGNFKAFINNSYADIFNENKAPVCYAKNKLVNKSSEINKNKPITAQSSYTLQVFGSYDLASVKHLQNQLKADLTTEKTKRNGRDWYVLTHGEYTSATQAKSSMKELPKELHHLSPWIRRTDDLTDIG